MVMDRRAAGRPVGGKDRRAAHWIPDGGRWTVDGCTSSRSLDQQAPQGPAEPNCYHELEALDCD